jgi:homoserine dehydrogenase
MTIQNSVFEPPLPTQETEKPKEFKLALIGFGNVGQSVAEILAQREGHTDSPVFRIVAVCDATKGSLYEPGGLDPRELIKAVNEGNLETIPAQAYGWDALQTIRESNADVVVEMTYTDLKTGQPAISHVEAALKQKKHVVMTNKGPVALNYHRLQSLAAANGVKIGMEGTVMSGTPTLMLGRKGLRDARISRIQGIINGTTNYILSCMAEGADYSMSLREAQKMGYAESDPTGDVEGYDAVAKIVIMANMLMDTDLAMSDVEREGITGLTAQDIASAKAAGECWKLIGKLEKDGAYVKASVKPTRLPLSHPLASVGGCTNAVTFTTEYLGEVTLIGPGAGRLPSGYAVLLDLLDIYRNFDEENCFIKYNGAVPV